MPHNTTMQPPIGAHRFRLLESGCSRRLRLIVKPLARSEGFVVDQRWNTGEASREYASLSNERIRKEHHLRGKTIRRIARESGWSRRQVRMVLAGASPEYWLGWGHFEINSHGILVEALSKSAGAYRKRVGVLAVLLVARWGALLLVLLAVPAGLLYSWGATPVMVLAGAALGRRLQVRTERAVKEDAGFSNYAALNRLFYRRPRDMPVIDEALSAVFITGVLSLASVVLAILIYASLGS